MYENEVPTALSGNFSPSKITRERKKEEERVRYSNDGGWVGGAVLEHLRVAGSGEARKGEGRGLACCHLTNAC